MVQLHDLVVCLNPPAQPGSVAVWLTHLGVPMQHRLQFKYNVEPVVTHSFPLMGPVRGGTVIAIYGYDLSAAIHWCRFSWGPNNGSLPLSWRLILARRRSSNLLECISPAASTSFARIDLSAGDRSCFSNSNVAYEFHSHVLVALAVPSKGGTSGQLPVRVYAVGVSRRASNLQHLRCKFGNLTTRAQMRGDHEVECISPPGRPGFVSLEVSNNLQDYSRSNQVFEYQMVVLTGIAPNKGPISGRTVVTISGMGLLSFAHYDTWCTFGAEEAIRANVISSNSVSCETPSASTAGAVAVGLYAGGMTTMEAVTFNFVQELLVASAHPLIGPTRGGTTISIDGRHFTASTWCRFDASLVPAVFLSSTRLQCESPMHASGLVELAVSSNGVDFAQSGLRYQYVLAAELQAISPRSGPTDGGTFVLLRGEFLSERAAALSYLHCRFNLTAVPAAFVSTQSIACYSVEMSSGAATVAATNNLRDYSHGLFFQYRVVRISQAAPMNGPVRGGTNVHISGGPFDEGEIMCHFDTHMVGGNRLSESVVSCIAPQRRLAPSPVVLRVTSTEATYASTLTFVYVGQPEVRQVSPRSGPVAGGTILIVQGAGFEAPDMMCTLETVALSPLWRSSDRMKCVTPNFLVPALNMMRAGGQDTANSVVFAVMPVTRSALLQPRAGPVLGGTSVHVVGRYPFARGSGSSAMCRFNDTLAAGSVVLLTLILCQTPASQIAGFVSVEVVTGMFESSHAAPHFLYEVVELLALSPASGPVDGQTRIFLAGTGALAQTLRLQGTRVKPLACEFGGVVQPAKHDGSTLMMCHAPRKVVFSRVSVRLLGAGGATHTGGLQYAYYTPPSISSLTPVLGPITAGTVVQVHGSDMTAAGYLFCRFRSVAARGVQVVLGIWKSASRVDCVAPRAAAPGQASVELSSNAQNFTSNKLVFEYHADVSIAFLRPARVPMEGGRLVTIRGMHFSQRASQIGSLRCRFGSVTRQATFHGSTTVACVSPPSSVGSTRVGVSNNGLDFIGDEQQIEFVRIGLVQLSPATGPAAGRTLVTVLGGPFAEGDYTCVFGAVDRAATHTSPFMLHCPTPALTSKHRLHVTVSIKLSNVTLSESSTFIFHPAPRLFGLQPTTGPINGATPLVVLGQAIQATHRVWCKFVRQKSQFSSTVVIVPARRMSSFEVSCVTPAMTSPGPHLVELSFSDQHFTSNRHLFVYHPVHQLTKLVPSFGPARGGTLVRTVLQYVGSLVFEAELKCLFNRTATIASTTQSGDVKCRAPWYAQGVVQVSLGGLQTGLGSLSFEFQAVRPRLSTPSSGPVFGGTRIVIHDVVMPTAPVTCRFCVVDECWETASAALSATRLACLSPPAPMASQVRLDLMVAATIAADGLKFSFHSDADVLQSLWPPTGPMMGGTLVRILARNPGLQVKKVLCKFGAESAVPARWVLPDEVECVAPAARRAQSVLVLIAQNEKGGHAACGGTFAYHRPPQPGLVVPGKGVLSGGTLLNVTGVRFMLRSAALSQLACVVNGLTTPTTFKSTGLILCRSPASPGGYATITVTGSSGGLGFEYLSGGALLAVPEAGPVSGITMVQLHSSGQIPCGPSMQCTVAGARFPAYCLTTRSVKCRINPQDAIPRAPGTQLRLWSDGALVSEIFFDFLSGGKSQTLSPVVGPAAGGTRVFIAGNDFSNRIPSFARFDSSVVPCRVLSAKLLECVVPPYLGACPSVGCSVAVHLEGAASSDETMTYSYEPELNVMRVWPTYGPSNGGTSVEVWGGGFVMGERLLCRFASTTVAALAVDEHRAKCRAPPGSEGLVAFQLSRNGADFSDGGVFRYAAVTPLSTYPPSGPSSGHTRVLLVGEHLTPSHLLCVVGNVQYVRAHFESAAAISFSMGSTNGSGRTSIELRGAYGALYSSAWFGRMDHAASQSSDPPTTTSLNALQSSRRTCHTPTLMRSKHVGYLSVNELRPSRGPSHGGAMLSLRCYGTLAPPVMCIFNRSSVPATAETSQTVVCATPKHEAGFVHVRVGSASCLRSEIGFFEYTTATSLNRRVISRLGETTICAQGVLLYSELRPWCINQALTLPGYLCSGCGFCCSALLPNRGAVQVWLAIYGAPLTSAQQLSQANSSLHTVNPSLGPSSGGTLITFHGSRLEWTGRAFCLFGTQLRVVRRTSDELVQCYSPPGRSDHVVLIAARGQSSMQAWPFAYLHPKALLSGPRPRFGPTSGGTLVSIDLEVSVTSAGSCSFDGKRAAGMLVEHLIIACVSPSHDAGAINVETTTVEDAINRERATFTYGLGREPVLRPSSGPLSGGTMIMLSDRRGWVAGGASGCSFAGSFAAVQQLAPTHVVCFSPRATQPGRVTLTVWADGAPLYRSPFKFYADASVVRVHPKSAPMQGGTIITLAGRHLQAQGHEPRCNFGDATAVPALTLGLSRLGCVSPVGGAGVQRMRVSLNRFDWARAGTVRREPGLVIRSAAPLCGPVSGGTKLLIGINRFGSSRRPWQRALCRVGGLVVAATVLNSTTVECRTPAHSPGYKDLDVSTNIRDFSPVGVLFEYVDFGMPLRIRPSSGPESGGTAVTITMRIPCERRAWCLFGEHETRLPASQISPSGLICVTPKQTEARVTTPVRIAVEGNPASALLSFKYQPSILVHGLHPEIGVTEGGTRVEVVGHSFPYGMAMRCSFDDVHVTAQRLSAKRLACVAPAASAGTVSVLLVDQQGISLAAGAHLFEYRARPSVSVLRPSVGAIVGGTLVGVGGSAFLQRAGSLALLTCRFNETVLMASFVDERHVRCWSPPLVSGSVILAVSNNRQDFSLQPAVFKYGAVVSMLSFEARAGAGGALVELRAHGDLPSDPIPQLSCTFDGHQTAASFASLAWIRCASPSRDQTTRIAADQYRLGRAAVRSPRLGAIMPPTGPVAGGQLVTVFGIGFRNVPNLRCSFGGAIVRARFVNVETVTCVTPSQVAAAGMSLTISVASDRQVSPSKLLYKYTTAPRITQFITDGDHTVSTSRFAVLGRHVSSQSSCANYLSPIWLSPTEVLCVPAGQPGNETRLLRAGPSFERTQPLFAGTGSPYINELEPSEGPERGGTQVTLKGGNLPRTLGCKFGTMPAVLAPWLHSAQATCVSPPRLPGLVLLQILTPTRGITHETKRLFRYTAACTVKSVLPSRGATIGGARLLVGGAHFDGESFTVHFGRQLSFATRIDQSTIECISPAHALGQVLVQVSSAQGEDCAGGALFVFENATVLTVQPQQGPVNGGTTLVVWGSITGSTPAATCMFGHGFRSAARVTMSRLECTAPPSAVGRVALYIVATGGTFSLPSFEYQAAARVFVASPSHGGAGGGTLVRVHGRAFSERSARLSLVGCGFNLTIVSATFSAQTNLLCESPGLQMTQALAGSVPLEVTNNLVDFTTDGVLFKYVRLLWVSRIVPTHGPVGGGTQISIFTSQFNTSRFVWCQLGGLSSNATFVSASQVSCGTPRQTLRPDSVRIVLEGSDLQSHGQHTFTYYAVPHVIMLSPPCGPRRGGTRISIHGTNLPTGRTIACRFDNVIVPSTSVSSEWVNCTAPPHTPGLVTVEVQGGGLASSSSQVTFFYHEIVEIGALQPSIVATNGRSVLRIHGKNFLPGGRCMLEGGDVFAAAFHTWISSSEMVCQAVRFASAGHYKMRVTTNMREVAEQAITIRVVEEWKVQHINPTMGPAAGGTVVRVTGGPFPPGPQLLCRIGVGAPTAARWLSAAHVACVTRPRPAGLAVVAVTGNGQDYSEAAQRFEYVAAATVLALSPRHGPVGGGTLVALRGGPFSARAAALGRMLCRFDRSLSAARLVSGHVAECASPPHAAADVWVQLTMNGLDFTQDGARFSYRGPTIRSVQPVLGPELGGTLLSVSGAGMPRGSPLACHFGSFASSPAAWVSGERIQCVTPASPAGVAAISVALAKGPMALSVAEHRPFEFQAAVVVRSVAPSAGPALGGTPVTVHGMHFSARSAELAYLVCRFNGTTSEAARRNASVLVCLTPAITERSFGARSPRAAIVQVSNNAIDFSTNGAHFEYATAMRLATLRPTAGPRVGGSLVTLTGDDFARGVLRCHFGQLGVAGSFVATDAVQCLTPRRGAGAWSRVAVRLSVDGGAVSAAGGRLHFVYQDEPTVRRLTPTMGPEEGRTRVSILGSGFVSTASLKCRFADVVVNAIYVSGELVNCTSPAHMPGVIAVEVSVDSLHFSASNSSFVYHAAAQVVAVVPSTGPTRGGTNVSLSGRGLLPGSACSFGGRTAARALWLSHFEIVCESPPRPSGARVVELTGGALGSSSSALGTFTYVPPLEAARLEPMLGPVAGGTVVRVTGGPFPPGPQLLCRIGVGAPTAARWLSAAHVACVTRPRPAGLAVVAVTGNGQDYSEAAQRFEYVAAATVLALSPRHGPVGGGTLVALRGGPFSARAAALGRMLCRFDRSLSAARLVSGHVAECASPPHAAADVWVQLTMNGLDFTQDGARFSYRGPTIRSVQPVLGPELGGTNVLLDLSQLPDPDTIHCRFGSSPPVPADVLNSSWIRCVSPQHSVERVQLRLFSRGHIAADPLQIGFEFHASLEVHRVVPSSGSSMGGEVVTVFAANLRFAILGVRCSFDDVLVNARVVNASAVLCTAPPHAPSIAPVRLSLNGQDFSTSRVTYAFVGWAIQAVLPSRGPTAGGTIVILEMQGRPAPAELMCRFGTTTLVSAEWLPGSALQCRSPAHLAASVALDIVAIGGKDTEASATFDYFEEPRIQRSFPSRLLQRAVSLVYLQGSNFVSGTPLACMFGVIRTNATFVNNQTMACVAPRIHETGRQDEVSVRVSMNGHDYTTAAARVQPTACPHGALCLASQSLPCAPGAQCTGQLGSNLTRCPAGSFEPEGGRSSCVPCTRGSYCPSVGLTAPMPCVPGMVCSLRALTFPQELCPAGHFCPRGVKTSDPGSTEYLERPLACPQNTWCAAGVATNATELGNFRTPQPCLAGFVCFRGSSSPHGSGPCPSGYYCPPNALPIACPPANYCPGVGNIFPSRCTPGFYNDRSGRYACIECPIGHICPVAGLEHPVICPAGSVCNVPGLKVPSSLCPAGYHCWEGTETEDWNAETLFKPIQCSEATYCLGGITNNITNENDHASPQPCPHGHFCKEASTTPFGTGRCPAGFFCPKGTADPFPAPAGYFCKGEGNAMAAPCLPGTWAKYNPYNGTDTCGMCPAGYSCEREGTFAPRPCLPGSYRQFNATIACQLCPEGSWNPFYANPLESLCLPCPEGRVCPVKGMTNVSQSISCPEGYICGYNTTSGSQFETECPPGYWCDSETKPSHFYCAADSATQQERANIAEDMEGPEDPICPCLDTCGRIERQDGKRCYCPMGPCPAGSVCYSGTKFSQKSRNPCPPGHYCPEGTAPADLQRFRCPNGTRSDQGQDEVVDCVRSGLFVTAAISNELFGSGGPLYEIVPASRLVQELASVVENDPCKQSRVGDGICAGESTRRQLQADQMLTYLSERPELITFRLPPFTLARFTFDFLRVPTEMVYDDHYRIAVFVNGHTQPSPYPPSFWFNPPSTSTNPLYPEFKEYRWSKSDVFAMHLHALRELSFRVELQILHGLFSERIDAFKASMQLEVFDSSRADQLAQQTSGTRKMIFAAIMKDSTFAAPLNLPRLRPDIKHYPGLKYLEPHMKDNLAATLEFSMMNESGAILIDPLEKAYNVGLNPDDYWGSLLEVAPMHYLPYFSHCVGGYRIGTPPTGLFNVDMKQPFSIGYEDALGGGPVRQRGELMRCNCRGREMYLPVCPPEPGMSQYQPNECGLRLVGGQPQGELLMRIKRFPNLGAYSPRDDQWLLTGDFVVRRDCVGCEEAGHAPGEAYPAIHRLPNGDLLRLPGWDSHAPIFWAFENPDSCDLVPPELTEHISQFTWGAVDRYSDTCDYVMQCVFEENTIIKLDRSFWFNGLQDDMVFYITQRPTAIDSIEEGFCFPELNPETDTDCKGDGYFYDIREMLENQILMFIKVQRDMKERLDWFPHRVQFELRYWQRSQAQKHLINGYVIMRDFAPLHDYYSPEHAANPFEVVDVSNTEGLRGHQYDLRITFIPVDWMQVLNKFALQSITYVIFYFVIDAAMIILIMCAVALVVPPANSNLQHLWPLSPPQDAMGLLQGDHQAYVAAQAAHARVV